MTSTQQAPAAANYGSSSSNGGDVDTSSANDNPDNAPAAAEEITVLQVFGSIVMGLLFGLSLEKSRVFEPYFIRTQMTFQTFLMLKTFLAALATSALAFALFSVAKPELFAAVRFNFDGGNDSTLDCASCSSPYRKGLTVSAAGAFILGIGMTVAGACPGMVLAQVGAGTQNSGLTLLGGLLGSLAFSLFESKFRNTYSSARVSTRHVDALIGTGYAKIAVALALGAAAMVAVMDVVVPWQTELLVNNSDATNNVFELRAWPPYIPGIIIGSLQLAAVLVMTDSIGSSSAYTTIVSQLVRFLPASKRTHKSIDPEEDGKKTESAADGGTFQYMESAAVMSAGNLWQVIYCSFSVLGGFLSASASSSFGSAKGVTPAAAIVGGFLMLFGSRLGSGCTSGHGISGFSLLFVNSVVAVPAMFAGGICAAFPMLFLGGFVYSDGSVGAPGW